MKLAWLTDIHLNFVGRSAVEALCNTIRSSGADAILITGDIATSRYFRRYLEYLAEDLHMPIYFVLGNHDYYGSSIRSVCHLSGRRAGISDRIPTTTISCTLPAGRLVRY